MRNLQIDHPSQTINADLSQPAAVRANELPWQPSPSETVWRKTFYREGGEYGPVTSLVRYDARSRFASHAHPGGEEILVLSGVFSDEHGHYPAGSYILNPPGTAHAPYSEKGCQLFVHLRQYAGPQRRKAVIDTTELTLQPTASPGVHRAMLYAQDLYPETVSYQLWQSGAHVSLDTEAGFAEILVLSGALSDTRGEYEALTWLRMPQGSGPWVLHSERGCSCYIKLGAANPR